MIEDISSLKRKLEELAEIVNKFQSEQVQLRIVEYVLGASPVKTAAKAAEPPRESSKKTGKGKKTSPTPDANGKKRTARSSRLGPATALSQLKDEGFFSEHRTINVIIEYLSSKKAKRFKPNELSGALARFVREGRLDREQNNDSQYEYFSR